MIYKRVLNDSEIYGIARYCQHPDDVAVRPQVRNVETYGQARVSVSQICPRVNGKIMLLRG